MRYICMIWLVLVSQSLLAQQVVVNSDRVNSERGLASPYVLLISIDGFRWDYIAQHKPEFLSKFAAQSASLRSLRPSYPTKTYPNHISIVTGLYPQNHGIVANQFIDRDIKKIYQLSDRGTVEDGRYYQGLSIWGLAEQAGIKTASYYWPGSESDNKNYQPSYFLYYQHNRPHQERIGTVLSWFNLPAKQRPHFVSLYFHEVDSAGHHYGPGSKQVTEAINKVDRSIETIVKELEKLGLDMNVIIVSDHGMAELKAHQSIVLPHIPGFKTYGNGPQLQFYLQQSTSTELITPAISTLNKAARHYSCSTPANTEKKLNINKAKRLGDIVCLADRGWSLFSAQDQAEKGGLEAAPEASPGNHGWSQFDSNDMHGIFYANGPLFKTAYQINSLNNVDIYPLLARLLKLRIKHPIDGNIRPIASLLKSPALD